MPAARSRSSRSLSILHVELAVARSSACDCERQQVVHLQAVDDLDRGAAALQRQRQVVADEAGAADEGDASCLAAAFIIALLPRRVPQRRRDVLHVLGRQVRRHGQRDRAVADRRRRRGIAPRRSRTFSGSTPSAAPAAGSRRWCRPRRVQARARCRCAGPPSGGLEDGPSGSSGCWRPSAIRRVDDARCRRRPRAPGAASRSCAARVRRIPAGAAAALRPSAACISLIR